MSPELLRLSEQRAYSAFLWTIVHAIIVTHLAYATAWLCLQLSLWTIPTAYVGGLFAGLWWRSFKLADHHFAIIEAANLSRLRVWQRGDVHTTGPSLRADSSTPQ